MYIHVLYAYISKYVWLYLLEGIDMEKSDVKLFVPQNTVYYYVTVWAKIHLVRTCLYFEKYHFKNSIKKTSLALVLESFTEHNNT